MVNAKRSATIRGSDTRPRLVLLPGIVADLFASVGNVFMRLVLHFFCIVPYAFILTKCYNEF